MESIIRVFLKDIPRFRFDLMITLMELSTDFVEIS